MVIQAIFWEKIILAPQANSGQKHINKNNNNPKKENIQTKKTQH